MYCISRIFHTDALNTGMDKLHIDGEDLYGI
jgi:hypothetical protein